MNLRVETERLIQHGQLRSRDALISDAQRQLIDRFKHLHPKVWGEMSFVNVWIQGWKTSCDNRLTEATSMRDIMAQYGTSLVQAAADYENVDTQNALKLWNSTNDLGKIGAGSSNADGGVTNTLLKHMYGDKLPYESTGDGGLRLNFFDKDDRSLLQPEYREDLGKLPSGSGSMSIGDRLALIEYQTMTGRAQAQNAAKLATPGLTKLNQFRQHHYKIVKTIENEVTSHGLGNEIERMPTAMIDETGEAFPGVIINHAELAHAVGRNITQVRTSMKGDVDRLKDVWLSEGGSLAYFHSANNMLEYLDKIAKHNTWLGNEGKKAGDAVDKLLLAYADVGYEKIDGLIAKWKEYQAAVKEACDIDADNLLKSVANILSGIATAYLAQWKEANRAAHSTAKIADRASEAAPNLGTSAHAPEAPPRGVPTDKHGTKGWIDGDDWSAGQPNPKIRIPTA